MLFSALNDWLKSLLIRSHHQIKKSPQQNFPFPPPPPPPPLKGFSHPLTLFGKPCIVILDFPFQLPSQAKFLGVKYHVKDPLDPSQCSIPESPIFHERVEA